MLEVTPEQALAFRVVGHGLHAFADRAAAVAACGVQDFPPGQVSIALLARTGDPAVAGAPTEAGEVVVNAMRGAPHLVPRADVAVFTRALVPEDDDLLRGLLGSSAAKEIEAAGFTVRDALDRACAAARDGLADGPLGRDDFHQALRERLPDGLLPWCRGCESHHARPAVWRALGPLGVTEMPARAVWALAGTGATGAASSPVADDLDAARAELVRRFLRCFGPATHSQLAAWAQTAPAYAKRLFAAVGDELTEVRQDGAKRWVLTADLDRLAEPPPARGVRMLAGFDPYVAQPDRTTLVPHERVRKALFPAVGRPGVVLSDGALAGLWRGRKKGSTLEVALEWTGAAVDLGDLPAQVARLRGCSAVRLV